MLNIVRFKFDYFNKRIQISISNLTHKLTSLTYRVTNESSQKLFIS